MLIRAWRLLLFIFFCFCFCSNFQTISFALGLLKHNSQNIVFVIFLMSFRTFMKINTLSLHLNYNIYIYHFNITSYENCVYEHTGFVNALCLALLF